MGLFAPFEIIVIPIRVDFELPKKPAETELTMIFLNKLVNGYSISFAKNAAAFFKKAISFSFSASSRVVNTFPDTLLSDTLQKPFCVMI